MNYSKCPDNLSNVKEFYILGFQNPPALTSFVFLLFCAIYTVTVTGNILIIFTVSMNNCLHLPMYFFLCNLSFLEIWYVTTTIPAMLGGLVTRGNTFSLTSCISQWYLFASLAVIECFLLTVMSYDRYLAICYPLRYSTLMGQRLCLQLTVSMWILGFIPSTITLLFLCHLQFFDHNEIDHFFCDIMLILKSVCSDASSAESEVFLLSLFVTAIPFFCIIVSYAHIITAIIKIPSTIGRHKAFSTCSSHLAVVMMYFGTMITLYVAPTEDQSLNLNKALSLLYTVATPMLNPIIYTLRNKDILEAMRKTIRKWM
ncbi:olfactory receptor 11L1-like [Pleurodeles waltl]|uniref:olfactory receptor 11L1-like n=1 Tax=Pleurodeles waltl TaxID=8319 RepID=UPI0037099DD3